jgi:hypothetical protein
MGELQVCFKIVLRSEGENGRFAGSLPYRSLSPGSRDDMAWFDTILRPKKLGIVSGSLFERFNGAHRRVLAEVDSSVRQSHDGPPDARLQGFYHIY